MEIIRATFFFEDDNKHGWSETIFTTKPDLTSALEAANTLMEQRRNCLGTTARVTYLRVSDDEVKRDSLINIVAAGDGVVRVASETAADIANTSLIVRMEASPVSRRTLYMRGIPDDCVTRSGQYTPTAAFQTAFNRWRNRILIDGWACKSRTTPTVSVAIDSITQVAATGVVTITTALPHGITVGKGFIIRGCKGCPEMNGTWTPFQVPSTTTITLVLTTLIRPYAGSGTTNTLNFLLAAITDVKVVRVSHRNAGRPFDSPVGRRRRRKVK